MLRATLALGSARGGRNSSTNASSSSTRAGAANRFCDGPLGASDRPRLPGALASSATPGTRSRVPTCATGGTRTPDAASPTILRRCASNADTSYGKHKSRCREVEVVSAAPATNCRWHSNSAADGERHLLLKSGRSSPASPSTKGVAVDSEYAPPAVDSSTSPPPPAMLRDSKRCEWMHTYATPADSSGDRRVSRACAPSTNPLGPSFQDAHAHPATPTNGCSSWTTRCNRMGVTSAPLRLSTLASSASSTPNCTPVGAAVVVAGGESSTADAGELFCAGSPPKSRVSGMPVNACRDSANPLVSRATVACENEAASNGSAPEKVPSDLVTSCTDGPKSQGRGGGTAVGGGRPSWMRVPPPVSPQPRTHTPRFPPSRWGSTAVNADVIKCELVCAQSTWMRDGSPARASSSSRSSSHRRTRPPRRPAVEDSSTSPGARRPPPTLPSRAPAALIRSPQPSSDATRSGGADTSLAHWAARADGSRASGEVHSGSNGMARRHRAATNSNSAVPGVACGWEGSPPLDAVAKEAMVLSCGPSDCSTPLEGRDSTSCGRASTAATCAAVTDTRGTGTKLDARGSRSSARGYVVGGGGPCQPSSTTLADVTARPSVSTRVARRSAACSGRWSRRPPPLLAHCAITDMPLAAERPTRVSSAPCHAVTSHRTPAFTAAAISSATPAVSTTSVTCR